LAEKDAAEILALRDSHAELKNTLEALTSNPYLNLGDLVYQVREREGKGWEGPAVVAWSNAIDQARAALANAAKLTGEGA